MVGGKTSQNNLNFELFFSLDGFAERSLQVNAYYMTKKERKKSMSENERANCKVIFSKKILMR